MSDQVCHSLLNDPKGEKSASCLTIAAIPCQPEAIWTSRSVLKWRIERHFEWLSNRPYDEKGLANPQVASELSSINHLKRESDRF